MSFVLSSGDECKLYSSSLSISLQPPVSSVFVQRISSATPPPTASACALAFVWELTFWLTLWESSSGAVTQKFPKVLWNPKVHYRNDSSPLTNPVHTTPSYFSNYNIMLSTQLCFGLPISQFPYRFSYRYPTSTRLLSIPATCLAHLILLDLIILIILSEKYKSRSCSLCSFMRPPVTLSLFDPNIVFSIPFSSSLSLCKIWGFHGGDCEECRLLGCCAVWLLCGYQLSCQKTSFRPCRCGFRFFDTAQELAVIFKIWKYICRRKGTSCKPLFKGYRWLFTRE
jgi:hypothetical protein